MNLQNMLQNKVIEDDSVFIVNSETSKKSGEHWLKILSKFILSIRSGRRS